MPLVRPVVQEDLLLPEAYVHVSSSLPFYIHSEGGGGGGGGGEGGGEGGNKEWGVEEGGEGGNREWGMEGN